MKVRAYLSLVFLLSFSIECGVRAFDNWPQPSGPHFNWQVDGKPPTHWSATRGEAINWRTPMPEAGMSSVTVWGDHVFVTTHLPIVALEDKQSVRDVVGYCLDADTGKILWQVELPGNTFISLAGGFTDGTVFAPITDGKFVWFFNRCGSMGCFDFEGNQIWLREWTPRFKHNNRQAEPFLVGDTILYVEVANKDAGAKMQKWIAPGKKTKGGIKIPEGIQPKEVWTYIHGIDKLTGKILWREDAGTVVHNTPVVGWTVEGKPAIAHARGGPHAPLEKPAGQSLTSLAPGEEGTTLWNQEIQGYDPSFASHWNSKYVFGFQRMNHLVFNASTGEIIRTQPVDKNAMLWKFDPETSKWLRESNVALKAGRRHPNTNQGNIVVGDWHWFLVHDYPYIGRVNIETGNVEYLEVPAQLMPHPEDRAKDVKLWGKPNPDNRPLNASGFEVGDKGHQGSGFGHISAASPILVGKYLFFTLVTGTVHVIDTDEEYLSPDSIVAINDLGPGGETWTLASLSFANGRLYAHTMKEILCIE